MADGRRCEDPFLLEQHDCSATNLDLGLDGFLYWVRRLRSRFISGNFTKFLLSFLPKETLTRPRKTEQATNSWVVVQVYSHVSERLPLFVSFVWNGLCRRWLLVGNLSKSFLIHSRANDISSESAKFLDFTPTLNCARRCGVWNMTRRLRIGYSFTIGCTWRWVTVVWFGGRWGHPFVDWLQGADNSIFLDVILGARRIWRRHRGIWNILFEWVRLGWPGFRLENTVNGLSSPSRFFLITNQSAQPVEMTDNNFMKYLIIYKKWLYLEEINEDRRRICDAFSRLVKPKPTIWWVNARFIGWGFVENINLGFDLNFQ